MLTSRKSNPLSFTTKLGGKHGKKTMGIGVNIFSGHGNVGHGVRESAQ